MHYGSTAKLAHAIAGKLARAVNIPAKKAKFQKGA